MAYRLKLSEPLAKSVRRIAAEQFAHVQDGEDVPVGTTSWLHETRKSLKRLRALLRLVRPGLPKEVWRQENAALREAGRMLSGQRDRDVMLQTIEHLRENANKALRASLTLLADRVAAQSVAAGAANGVLEEATRTLDTIRSRLTHLGIDGDTVETIEAGLQATYTAGRAALDQVRENPTDETFHELRKAVQLHWRHMLLLTDAWPEVLKARARTARDLAQIIGEDHDLAVLADSALAHVGEGFAKADADRIARACRLRQTELRRKALPSAGRLFGAKPSRFAAEIALYWRTTEGSKTAKKTQSRKPRKSAKAAGGSTGHGPAEVVVLAEHAGAHRRTTRTKKSPNPEN